VYDPRVPQAGNPLKFAATGEADAWCRARLWTPTLSYFQHATYSPLRDARYRFEHSLDVSVSNQDVDIDHQFAHLRIQLLDLVVLQFLLILRLLTEGVFRAAEMNRSFQSSISATRSPWSRAAPCTEGSPFRILSTRFARRLAVGR
jgi:hypothetical protein